MKYISTTQQVQQMSSALVYSEGRRAIQDPFWDEESLLLLNSMIAYVIETQPEESRNFHRVLDMLRIAGRKGDRREDLEGTELAKAMERLNREKPSCWAYKQFKNVDQAPIKTFNTIIATSIAKFSGIDTEEIAEMMRYDEIDLLSIGQRKTAVFVEVSDTDRSMDMLINLFFTQAMNQLCTYADEHCPGSRLPVPVRFLMDDFATNCRIDKFENMVSNIRSRKISVILILQSLAQLKAGYDESASTIVDDCDTLVYMGGNDPTTAHEIAVRCDVTTQSILRMPLCTSWIFRRGEKPFSCRNLELDDYLEIFNPKALKYKKAQEREEMERL